MNDASRSGDPTESIAVIGMAGRFPGARDLGELWRNLRAGIETIVRYTDPELRDAGVSEELLADSHYVKAGGSISGIELFDADFFGVPPSQAEILDPQQRLFLEASWQALEDAGCDPLSYPGLIGAYAGVASNAYLFRFASRPDLLASVGELGIATANEKDYLVSRVAFKLNLKGPSVGVQTACSSSLVAVHMACENLLSGDCDIALAGGVRASAAPRQGYFYHPDGIFSRDGQCRPFDADATGTVFTDGLGVVVLKRLDDALRDGDTIRAVILGSAVNNDGAAKVGYTAPGVEGQSRVISEALARAGLSPEDIDYVETHGTGTALGDPIEVRALTRVFAAQNERRGSCALGSVKSNLGHTDVAAGVTGLIKTVLALEHGELPPSLHFERPNPEIDFDQTPFFVNTECRPWAREDKPRRAGVSSFGIGGTNAHVILQEAPPPEPPGPSRPWQLLKLSARSETALEAQTEDLRAFLASHPQADLADVSHTLWVGRRTFEYRRALICQDRDQALERLGGGRFSTSRQERARRPVVFMFPGQGAQRSGMGQELYRSEPTYRAHLEACCEILKPHLQLDLRSVLFPAPAREAEMRERLDETAIAQPALFVTELCLARLLQEWGLEPAAMIGHSIGEYVAAHLAGVFSLEDALALVAERGRLMQDLPRGAMLAVELPAEEMSDRMGDGLSLAAINAAERCVVSGPTAAVEQCERRLAEQGIGCQLLHTSHAFHSSMMDPILESFSEQVRKVTLEAPTIPFVSNVSGRWIQAEEATDPEYWSRHLRRTVRFAEGLEQILEQPDRILLEVGPGRSLSSLAKRHPARAEEQVGLACLPGSARGDLDGENSELASLLSALGGLWAAGAPVDGAGLFRHQRRRRIPLPTYPFERRRFWIETRSESARRQEPPKQPTEHWFYEPRWRPAELSSDLARGGPTPGAHWLILLDSSDLGVELAERLQKVGCRVSTVIAGEEFADLGKGGYRIHPARREDYRRLMVELVSGGGAPDAVAHLWTLDEPPSELSAALDRGFWSLLFLAQAQLAEADERAPRLHVVTSQLVKVAPEDPISPQQAPMLGPLRVLPLEYRGLQAGVVDIPPPPPASSPDGIAERDRLLDLLMAELSSVSEPLVAFRGSRRWIQDFEPVSRTTATAPEAMRLRPDGVYLITGGFGGLGSTFARHLASEYGARLILTGRSGSPPRELWEEWPETHPEDEAAIGKIRLVRELEAAGGEVLAAKGDVADRVWMRELVAEIKTRFGGLDGVIHAAGVAGEGLSHHKTRRAVSAVMTPKIEGTLALADAVRQEDLDFLVLCSSTATVLGALEQADYSAANAFLDAFAQNQKSEGCPIVSIAWDAWHETGMATAAGEKGVFGQLMTGGAIAPSEGVEMLERILAGSQVPVVIACKRDFQRLVEHARALLRPVGAAHGRSLHPRPQTATAYVAPRTEIERQIADVWQAVLGVQEVGVRDNFFDLGGDSLLLMQVRNQMHEVHGYNVAMPAFFKHPTITTLAEFLDLQSVENPDSTHGRRQLLKTRKVADDGDVAVIGMSGCFPGARNLDQYWRNLRDGIESISFFSDEELLEAGLHPEILRGERFVKALPLLEDPDWFDAKHFGITPREAETIDPQQRVFLETASEALELAGYNSETYPGLIGAFAGAGVSRYWLNVASDPKVIRSVGVLQMVIGNDKDYLPTRVSFKLNLRGPAVNVQSACSTSLIAVHLACRSLLNGECDMALAGGVALAGTEKGGYYTESGGMLSSDGHCRPFDSKASGTIFGSGSGVVILKPLAAALADGDTVHAVIKGSAINNDGAMKVGYTAPGVDGQVRVIHEALESAAITPEAISYIEAHGTATQLGDPIEVAALREVFGTHPDETCALGSVKSNIGHADAAAGIAGLLKTILALKHGKLPPSLHFDEPNPEIDLDNSPLYVNAKLSDWIPANGGPRRAGVSAFGVGGSNAHVVVEEAPEPEPTGRSRPWQLLVLSARTPTALDAATSNLVEHLENHPEIGLPDVAYTLQVGRRAFRHRRFLISDNSASAVSGLGRVADGAPRPKDALAPISGNFDGQTRPVVFLFPGQGAQYVGMGGELYEHMEVFKRELDRCCDKLEPHLGCDLRSLLFDASPAPDGAARDASTERDGDGDPEARNRRAAERLSQTRFTQPALFAIEVAMARQWMAWGVRPSCMVGHSIGEYVAAHLAGVLSLNDALMLVTTRGRLMQSADPGAMVSIPLAADELAPLLREAAPAGQLSIASVNAPERSVAGGTFAAVEQLTELLKEEGIEAKRLHTSHAFHSPMMEPILGEFRQALQAVELHAPSRPFYSNLSGRLITDSEAQDPEYWVRHLRQPVRFADAVERLCREDEPLLLEVGPGRTLGSLAKLNPIARRRTAIYSLPGANEQVSEQVQALTAVGQLWLAGIDIDWPALSAGERRRRVPLPTYPFERKRYFIKDRDLFGQKKYRGLKKEDLAEWFYIPVWRPSDFTAERELESEGEAPCLVFADDTGLAESLAPRLEERLAPVTYVRRGEGFASHANGYTIDPGSRSDFEALIQELRESDNMPRLILFLWSVNADPVGDITAEQCESYLREGIYALFHLVQLLEELGEGDPMHLVLVSTGVHAVDGSEILVPEKATLVGPATVIPQEYRNILGHSIDLVLPTDWRDEEELIDRLVEEMVNDQPEMAIAYRQRRRWVQAYEPVRIEAKAQRKPHFREQGCYLITGGLGGLGRTFARHLAVQARARLILTGRSALPPRETWSDWLAEHDRTDSVYRKIRIVQELEELGAEVMVVSADVADRQLMAEAVEEARRRFGPIHGVFHAAGLPSGGLVQNKELETIVETLAPKVQGTRVLESLLSGEELDFFVLFSSSGAILGGLGYYDYGAANAFLDAFANARSAAGQFTQSINWGPWQEAGMAVVSNMGFVNEEAHQAFLRQGISTTEGMEIFHRILDRHFPQVAIWTMDFMHMIEGSRLLRSARDQEEDEESRQAHPRPELPSDYVAPRDEMESDLSEIWRDLLGIDQVGIHDDFFELGADSLLATQMLSRIRRQLGVSVPHPRLFEAPNIVALAAIVREMESPVEIEGVESLIAEIESMSEAEIDEVGGLLNDAEGAPDGKGLSQQSRGGP